MKVEGQKGNGPVGVIVEGGPDLLAACQLILEEGLEGQAAPICFFGASQLFPESTLPLLAGRRFLIVEQRDAAKTRRDGSIYYPGQECAARWLEQLQRAKARASILHLPEEMPGKDLNDWVRWREPGASLLKERAK